mgnify:CR=1 FL=1
MHPGMSFAVGQTPLKGREESQKPKKNKNSLKESRVCQNRRALVDLAILTKQPLWLHYLLSTVDNMQPTRGRLLIHISDALGVNFLFQEKLIYLH